MEKEREINGERGGGEIYINGERGREREKW